VFRVIHSLIYFSETQLKVSVNVLSPGLESNSARLCSMYLKDDYTKSEKRGNERNEFYVARVLYSIQPLRLGTARNATHQRTELARIQGFCDEPNKLYFKRRFHFVTDDLIRQLYL